ncbi:hypothetical protein C4D60_Mb09t08950 [Musa balbisiana]|uniref:non-specific serine/threonine protein kinase n=1 Tax=Musa balbisiana TaxID=52838 RepID=A0A4S8IF34_MUSBA|nr:hypothetical protein C4D60_Mb09t08950 [Musa balbisiana]
MASIQMAKPQKPLLSATIDLSSVLTDPMYVGFSSSTGSILTSHYILGWSFKMNGVAQALDYSLLPSLPRVRPEPGSKALAISLPLASAGLVLIVVGALVFKVRWRVKYAQLLEDWELEYGPHRFSYKDLYEATKGFKDKDLLGIGGFGKVYKGVLQTSKSEIAVKRVSHESRQGMREFIAEIVSIGRLRHRNLVQLLGYCRRKGELLLVYDYMPNGSLDKFLYGQDKPTLDWATRFRIIKGVASGLLYLHEDWEQVVIHRDIKASNVLLDHELNGRLGDFGLARLYDHGTVPLTTHVVGTMGYLAPELVRTGKAATTTDVFAFGIFLLEVYKGVLQTSKSEIAVKRVSHESRQGMREFVAEIVSIGRLRHRNLVQLLGYCRRKGELLLVYEYMPNGSLDKFLYGQDKPTLDWATRFRIIKGVASGLLYLHNDWEQVVIHRDIKASNVLLDHELNGRLGDFGLARLYDHGTVPLTTHVVGTMGYLAPELVRTGKAATTTDVFAFGIFLLEVACGRRPVDSIASLEELILLDWVVENWRQGSILATRDPKLGDEYVVEEVELVLKLGLLCSHPLPAGRPSMRQVVEYLEGEAALPELSPTYLSFSVLAMLHNEGFDDYILSYPSSVAISGAW